MNRTLQSRACSVVLTAFLVSSAALAAGPAGLRDLGFESFLLSLRGLLEQWVPAAGQSTSGAADGQDQPPATPSGSNTGGSATGGSGTSSDDRDDDRGSAMDPNG